MFAYLANSKSVLSTVGRKFVGAGIRVLLHCLGFLGVLRLLGLCGKIFESRPGVAALH